MASSVTAVGFGPNDLDTAFLNVAFEAFSLAKSAGEEALTTTRGGITRLSAATRGFFQRRRWANTSETEVAEDVKSAMREQGSAAGEQEDPNPLKTEIRPVKSPIVGYRAVRVLLLSWGNPIRVVKKLKALFAESFHFNVHGVSLIDLWVHHDKPEDGLANYLKIHGFLGLSNDQNITELVILVYDGRSSIDETGYFLKSGSEGSRTRMMSWAWLEKQLSMAPYDSLMILNCPYKPPEQPVNDREGINLVLAASGPGSDPEKTRRSRSATQWEQQFLHIIGDELESCLPGLLYVSKLVEKLQLASVKNTEASMPYLAAVGGAEEEREDAENWAIAPIQGLDGGVDDEDCVLVTKW